MCLPLPRRMARCASRLCPPRNLRPNKRLFSLGLCGFRLFPQFTDHCSQDPKRFQVVKCDASTSDPQDFQYMLQSVVIDRIDQMRRWNVGWRSRGVRCRACVGATGAYFHPYLTSVVLYRGARCPLSRVAFACVLRWTDALLSHCDQLAIDE